MARVDDEDLTAGQDLKISVRSGSYKWESEIFGIDDRNPVLREHGLMGILLYNGVFIVSRDKKYSLGSKVNVYPYHFDSTTGKSYHVVITPISQAERTTAMATMTLTDEKKQRIADFLDAEGHRAWHETGERHKTAGEALMKGNNPAPARAILLDVRTRLQSRLGLIEEHLKTLDQA